MTSRKKMPPPLPPPRAGSPRAQAAAARDAAKAPPRTAGKSPAKRETVTAKTSITSARTLIKEPARPVARPRAPRPAFPKKNQPPTPPAFAAQLPLALGKRLDGLRTFLLKQKGVREDVYFYGPESGWALRYLYENRPLCSLHVHDQNPVGIISLEAAVCEKVDWKALSPAARKARQQAHGSPSLLWLDVPLEEDGATDFRSMLRAKLARWAAAGPDGEDDRGDTPDA
jgi:hypothetical protein